MWLSASSQGWLRWAAVTHAILLFSFLKQCHQRKWGLAGCLHEVVPAEERFKWKTLVSIWTMTKFRLGASPRARNARSLEALCEILDSPGAPQGVPAAWPLRGVEVTLGFHFLAMRVNIFKSSPIHHEEYIYFFIMMTKNNVTPSTPHRAG